MRAVTDEAALTARPQDDLRVDPLVAEGELVAQGAPVLRLRHWPQVTIPAPMPGRVAAMELGPGRRLHSLKMFHEPGAGRHDHGAARAETAAALRQAVLAGGLWRMLRSRPFGAMPSPGEVPVAIVVTAQDTRPLAVDPRAAVRGVEPAFEAGLQALLRLTEGPVVLCQDRGAPLVEGLSDRLRLVRSPAVHPQGLAGVQVHRHCPAAPGRPVWDIAAEDVAGLGAFLTSGLVPDTRLVSVAGPGLKRPRLVRCQPGADLRQLCYGYENPGAHRILSGSALDGQAARWLGLRDRQVTVLDAAPRADRGHWFLTALQRAARPLPLIPTAAIEQALGDVLPAMPFLRALAAGDAETFTRLGGLSLLPEDLALVDYMSNCAPAASALMQTLLDRIAAEEGA